MLSFLYILYVIYFYIMHTVMHCLFFRFSDLNKDISLHIKAVQLNINDWLCSLCASLFNFFMKREREKQSKVIACERIISFGLYGCVFLFKNVFFYNRLIFFILPYCGLPSDNYEIIYALREYICVDYWKRDWHMLSVSQRVMRITVDNLVDAPWERSRAQN